MSSELLARAGIGWLRADNPGPLTLTGTNSWLVAPSSTVLQASPVHTGLCEEPAEVLDRLFAALVLPIDAGE